MRSIHHHPHQTTSLLSPQQLGALRKKLLRARDQILADYQRDYTAAQSIHEEGVEDLEELASLDLDREFLFARSEDDRETLLQIEEAVQRMNEGTYGLCLWSGEPIPVERLRLIPWARFSAGVQAKVETGELLERASGG